MQPAFRIDARSLVHLDGVQVRTRGRTNVTWVERLAPWKTGAAYTPDSVAELERRLLDTGVSLQNIRKAVDHLRTRGVKELSNITLLSDGATVYECTSAEEVVDLLAGGQGVFGIAVSGALRELSGELAELPAERLDGGPVHTADDELSMRRRKRVAG